VTRLPRLRRGCARCSFSFGADCATLEQRVVLLSRWSLRALPYSRCRYFLPCGLRTSHDIPLTSHTNLGTPTLSRFTKNGISARTDFENSPLRQRNDTSPEFTDGLRIAHPADEIWIDVISVCQHASWLGESCGVMPAGRTPDRCMSSAAVREDKTSSIQRLRNPPS
jgi:hypothetical protein